MDSYFLNDRAITRIPTKAGLGALTAVGTGFLFLMTLLPNQDPDGIGVATTYAFGLVVGYPLGVYLADPVESSFWMTYVGGYGLALGFCDSGREDGRDDRKGRFGGCYGVPDNSIGAIRGYSPSGIAIPTHSSGYSENFVGLAPAYRSGWCQIPKGACRPEQRYAFNFPITRGYTLCRVRSR